MCTSIFCLLYQLYQYKHKYWVWILVVNTVLATVAHAKDLVAVTLRPAAELLFISEHSAPSEVVPKNDTRLDAQLTARISAILAQVGEEVPTGAVLVRLDCQDTQLRLEAAQAAVRSAEVRLQLSRNQLQRVQGLKRDRMVSADELDRRQSEVSVNQAELAAQTIAVTQAKLQISYCVIKAPFTGMVKERLASVGDLATPGLPLLHLIQVDKTEVSAQVRPEDSAQLLKAASLSFAWQEHTYPLRLLRLSTLLDARTRTQEIRLQFTSNNAPLGVSGRLLWKSSTKHLPADLLVRRNGQLGVFIYERGRAHFQVIASAQEGQPAAIDLDPQTLLIIEGRDAIDDNDQVLKHETTASTDKN